MYDKICEELKPIPAKFHYMYNVRDVSRVFMGLLFANVKYVNSFDVFGKLWLHECFRVFSDRMCFEEDINYVFTSSIELIKNKFP